MPKILCACGRTVDTQPEWGGQWISCPGCQGTLYAPYPGNKPAPAVAVVQIAAPPPPPAPPPAASAQTRLCPWCAETIAVAATLCPFCKGDPSVGPGTGIRRAEPAVSNTDDGGWLPLVLGIVGFMFCQLLAPVAWALGSTYEKKCRAQGRSPSSAGTAGKLLGIVGTVFLFVILAFFVLSVVASA